MPLWSEPPPNLRVVSLLPAATEMVCALGLRENLVGVSHECDWPPTVAGLPVLTSSKVLSEAASAAIDADVRGILKGALAVYDVDVEALERAAPDLIVTQDLCDVCAVSLADVRAAVRELTRPEVEVVTLRPTRLDDVWEDLRRLAEATGRQREAEQLLEHLTQRLEAVGRRARAADRRPPTLTIEWIDPVMVGGTWMPELVELAGGEPLVTRPGDHAPALDRAQLAELSPEVVLVKPCGFSLRRTLAERDALEALLHSVAWPATRRGAVFVADGNAYFNRPGPRLVDSLEILAACVHPELFSDLAGRHSSGFLRLSKAP